MNEDLKRKIDRVKELIQKGRHASMATVNSDGSPHNTPFRFMHDAKLEHIYWASHPESLHSQNILRTGQIFVVLYDLIDRGGLYIKAEGGKILKEDEVNEGLEIHNRLRKEEGKDPLPESYYGEESPQKMWRAKIKNLWINNSERDANGILVKDQRYEISAKDLI